MESCIEMCYSEQNEVGKIEVYKKIILLQKEEINGYKEIISNYKEVIESLKECIKLSDESREILKEIIFDIMPHTKKIWEDLEKEENYV